MSKSPVIPKGNPGNGSPFGDERSVLFAQLGTENWMPSKTDLQNFEKYLNKQLGDSYRIVVWHSKSSLDVFENSDQPFVYARLGKVPHTMNFTSDWTPEEKDFTEFQEYLEEKVGDRYAVVVNHSGSNVEIID